MLPQFGDEKAPLAWYERGPCGMVKHAVSNRSYGQGIGVGDLKGDGRNDILTPQGWLEAPADADEPHQHAAGKRAALPA